MRYVAETNRFLIERNLELISDITRDCPYPVLPPSPGIAESIDRLLEVAHEAVALLQGATSVEKRDIEHRPSIDRGEPLTDESLAVAVRAIDERFAYARTLVNSMSGSIADSAFEGNNWRPFECLAEQVHHLLITCPAVQLGRLTVWERPWSDRALAHIFSEEDELTFIVGQLFGVPTRSAHP
jgi:hypothetical protein